MGVTFSPRKEYNAVGAQLDVGTGGNCQNWSGGSPSSGTWKLRIVYRVGFGVGAVAGFVVSLLPGISTSSETLQLATVRVQFSGTRGQLFCNIKNTVFRNGDINKQFPCSFTN